MKYLEGFSLVLTILRHGFNTILYWLMKLKQVIELLTLSKTKLLSFG
jgi:succinate dehydrogenase/fumarate reductase cytochrome b subunit